MMWAAACFALLQVEARADAASAGNERVVVRTSMGDVVLVLFPEIAPRHVAQFLALARAGAYDTVPFHRIVPGMVVQLAEHHNRRAPLNAAQRDLMKRLPLEISSLRHRRGILSMAHDDLDPHSAISSFSVLIADAPHLDGRYTIFGRVEKGMDVIDAIARLKSPESEEPAIRVQVERTLVLEGAQALESLELREALTEPNVSRARTVSLSLVIVGAAGMLFGVVAWAIGSRGKVRVRIAGLLGLLAAFFVLFVGAVQWLDLARSPILATVLLMAAFMLFRVMAGFEQPRAQRNS